MELDVDGVGVNDGTVVNAVPLVAVERKPQHWYLECNSVYKQLNPVGQPWLGLFKEQVTTLLSWSTAATVCGGHPSDSNLDVDGVGDDGKKEELEPAVDRKDVEPEEDATEGLEIDEDENPADVAVMLVVSLQQKWTRLGSLYWQEYGIGQLCGSVRMHMTGLSWIWNGSQFNGHTVLLACDDRAEKFRV